LKVFISYEKWELAWRILPKKHHRPKYHASRQHRFRTPNKTVNIAMTDKYVICFP
jgi:hypothetical protein